MGSKGKEKGADYERQTCQRLSLWVSGMTREDVFWRAAMSGGRATLKARKGGRLEFNAQQGDITAVHECGHALTGMFVIECKFYMDLHLSSFFFVLEKAEIKKIWDELLRQCDYAGGKLPLLIARQNRKPDLVCTSRLGCQLLDNGGDLVPNVIVPQYGMYWFLLRDVLTLDFSKIRPHCGKPVRVKLEE